MKNKGCVTAGYHERTRFVSLLGLLLIACSYGAAAGWCGQADQASVAKCVTEAPPALLTSDSGVRQFQQAFSASPHINTNIQNAAPANEPGKTSVAGLTHLRKSLESAARHGDSQAQVNLAVASLAGWGAPPSAGAALYWFHTAAERGYALAFYDLGILYMNGCGVRQDYAEAFRFFEKGARAGDSAAQVNLGYFYDQGLGITRDQAAAAFWYSKAADAGVAAAQYNLADLYLRGEGVAQDDVAAFRWFEQAALKGHGRARVMLGSMYAAGRGIRKDLAAAYMWLVASEMEGDLRCAVLLKVIEPQLSSAQVTEARQRAKSLGHSRPSDTTALLR